MIAVINTVWVRDMTTQNKGYSILSWISSDNCQSTNEFFIKNICAEAHLYSYGGIIVIIGTLFCVILEAFSLIRTVIKTNVTITWLPRCHFVINILNYSFLINLFCTLFWGVFTQVLFAVFNVYGVTPSWGFGISIVNSLLLVLIWIHYKYY